jgi:hypothetical protein
MGPSQSKKKDGTSKKKQKDGTSKKSKKMGPLKKKQKDGRRARGDTIFLCAVFFKSAVSVWRVHSGQTWQPGRLPMCEPSQLCGLWSHDFAAPLSVFLGSWDV